MATADLSREEKIREARRLRSEGLTAKAIAGFLGANESTVKNWYLGGDCKECGMPVDGSCGASSARHCSSCAPGSAQLWTADRIVEKIREWAERFGAPPTATEWNRAMARNHCSGARLAQIEGRWSSGEWPCTATACERFGSWNAAIIAAGFVPLPQWRKLDRSGLHKESDADVQPESEAA